MLTLMPLLFYLGPQAQGSPAEPPGCECPSAPRTTHPRQGLLFVQGRLSFDGGVPGAVCKEGTTWWERRRVRGGPHAMGPEGWGKGSPGTQDSGNSHRGPATPWSIKQP